MLAFCWLSDDEWARAEPLFPIDMRGRNRIDDRRRLCPLKAFRRIVNRFDRNIETLMDAIPFAIVVIWRRYRVRVLMYRRPDAQAPCFTVSRAAAAILAAVGM